MPSKPTARPPFSWRRLHALALSRRIVLPLFAIIAIVFTFPLYAHPLKLGFGDWLWFHFVWEGDRKTYLEFHEIPWWNPYHCGGNFGIANPNTFGLSPLFLLLLPLPAALGMKVFLTIMTFVGQLGTYELVRRFYVRSVWAVVAAIAFGCSGYFGWHMNGQTGMTNLQLLPLAFYLVRRGETRLFYGACAGACFAFMIFMSGIYPLVISGVCLVGYTLIIACRGQWARVWTLLKSGVACAIATYVLSAVKAIPMIDFLRDHRRPMGVQDAIQFPMFVDMLTVKRTVATCIWPSGIYEFGWWGEYGNYIGVIGIGLAVVAFFATGANLRSERWAVVLFIGFVLGNLGSFAPYMILRNIPMFVNLRVPTRYWVDVNLFWVAILATGLHRTMRLAAGRLAGWQRHAVLSAIVVAGLAFAVDMVKTNGIDEFTNATPTPAIAKSEPHPYTQTIVPKNSLNDVLWKNAGTLDCWEELGVGVSPLLRPDLPSQAYLADADAGTAEVISWTPNEWHVRVVATRATTLVLNQNTYRGWEVEGAMAVPHSGLLAADIPPGTREVTFRFRPVHYLGAVALTLFGLVGFVLWGIWTSERRGAWLRARVLGVGFPARRGGARSHGDA